MRASDCFKKRLLRKGKPDLLKASKALEMSDHKRKRAEELFENCFYEESIVTSYTSMFQAARALLFKDGITEKSHACVVSYLRENYAKSLGHDRISWLDTFRLERYESFYGLDPSELDKKESEDALNKSEKFFNSVENIIGHI
ncbi:MAG: HEPN domain-containing protein [Candidatus Asgardarchaeum californiense]|nr:MAG: HEPN domain-containing protein [Candidatus Asgardarchaeum californiense]